MPLKRPMPPTRPLFPRLLPLQPPRRIPRARPHPARWIQRPLPPAALIKMPSNGHARPRPALKPSSRPPRLLHRPPRRRPPPQRHRQRCPPAQPPKRLGSPPNHPQNRSGWRSPPQRLPSGLRKLPPASLRSRNLHCRNLRSKNLHCRNLPNRIQHPRLHHLKASPPPLRANPCWSRRRPNVKSGCRN